MHQALRPYVTTGVAIVGATVLVAAPLTIPPQSLAPLERSLSVTSAASVTSFIQGLLQDFNTATVAGGSAVSIPIETAGGLPLGLSLAAQAIIDNPANTVNVLNFLINSFVSPNPAFDSVFYQFGHDVIGPLISLLPPPLAAIVGGAFADLGAALAQGLSHLPGNPGLGGLAVMAAAAHLPTAILTFGLQTKAIGTAIAEGISGGYSPIPGVLLPTTGLAGWLGFTPTVLAATLQVAVSDPSLIPGLASYLIYSLVSPPSAAFPPPVVAGLPPAYGFPASGIPYPFGSYSLFVTTFAPLIATLEDVLPGPLSDALTKVSNALNEVLNKGLGILPDPVNPFGVLAAQQMLVADNVVEEPTINTAELKLIAPKPLTPAEALQVSANIILGDIQGLPAGIEKLVGAVQAGYLTVPEALSQLVNGLLLQSQGALAPVVGSLVALDPPIGGKDGLALKGATALGEVVQEIQKVITPPKQKSLAGVNSLSSGGSLFTLDLPKPKLNVVKLNPLAGLGLDGKKDDGDTKAGAPNLGNLFKPMSGLPKHEPGLGKVGVGDLVKKVSDDIEKATDSLKPKAAAG